MKTHLLAGVLLFVLVSFFSPIYSQISKLILYTQGDIQKLYLRDVGTGKTEKIPTWNKTGSGFLIECSSMQTTELLAKETTTFRLFSLDHKQTTTWIKLNENESLTFEKCFALHLGSTMEGNSTWPNTTDFVVSNYQGNPLYDNAVALRGTEDFMFDKHNMAAFKDKEDIKINWKLISGRVTEIAIIDVTDGDYHKVWQSNKFDKESLIFDDFKKLGNILIVENHDYNVEILVEDPQNAGMPATKHTFPFAMRPFVFQHQNPHFFIAKDSLNIKWNTNLPVSHLTIKHKANDKTIWETNSCTQNFIDYKILADAGVILTPQTRYTFAVQLQNDDNQTYTLDFEIVLSDEEFKILVDFMGE